MNTKDKKSRSDKTKQNSFAEIYKKSQEAKKSEDSVWEEYKSTTKPIDHDHHYEPAKETTFHSMFSPKKEIEYTLIYESKELNVLSRKEYRRFKPEDTLDLHGLTTKQAYKELFLFIKKSYNRGLIFVEVITGKGDPRNDETGILKQNLPHWIKDDNISPMVGGFSLIKPHMGGFAIRLKKSK